MSIRLAIFSITISLYIIGCGGFFNAKPAKLRPRIEREEYTIDTIALDHDYYSMLTDSTIPRACEEFFGGRKPPDPFANNSYYDPEYINIEIYPDDSVYIICYGGFDQGHFLGKAQINPVKEKTTIKVNMWDFYKVFGRERFLFLFIKNGVPIKKCFMFEWP